MSAADSPHAVDDGKRRIFEKKIVGFTIFLGIPILVAVVAMNGPIGILYFVVGGVIAAALVLRRRAFEDLARGSGGADDQN